MMKRESREGGSALLLVLWALVVLSAAVFSWVVVVQGE